jgi:excisionase family DNA binding protein
LDRDEVPSSQQAHNQTHGKPAQAKKHQNADLMSVNEATTFLHCHRITLLRLIGGGQLLLLKTGRAWNFRRAEVRAVSNRKIAIYPHLTIVPRAR